MRPITLRLRAPSGYGAARFVNELPPVVMKKALCSIGLVGLLAFSRQARAETYYGPEIATLARQTIDVMKLHQHVIQQQLALDETPAFFELSIRSMPATFQFDDGAKMRAGLSRAGLSMGIGFGKPTTGFAGFIGFQVDAMATTQFPNPFVATTEGEGFDYGQSLVYAGLAAHGFQFTYGLLISGDQASGLSPQGYFTRQNFGYRDGTPAEVYPTGDVTYSHFVTFSQAEGLSLGATLAEIDGVSDVGDAQESATRLALAAFRAEFAPAKWIERLDLRERLGVPGIGLNRYAARIDYWGDRYHEVRRQAESFVNEIRAGKEMVDAVTKAPAGEESGKETWEIPVFLEDIVGTGVTARIIPQVLPTVKLRALEASYRYQVERLKVGARTFAFQRGKALTGSAEAYVAFQPEFFKYLSILGVPWMTFSYSYNTPDAATFLPIPNAHVLGVQWIYGRPEMGRPLVPLVAQHQRDGDGE